MTKIAKNLTDLIGNTPLLELSNFNRHHQLASKLIAKLEYFNPLGSVKDRIGYAMIKDAEDKGKINKDTVIIEPTRSPPRASGPRINPTKIGVRTGIRAGRIICLIAPVVTISTQVA